MPAPPIVPKEPPRGMPARERAETRFSDSCCASLRAGTFVVPLGPYTVYIVGFAFLGVVPEAFSALVFAFAVLAVVLAGLLMLLRRARSCADIVSRPPLAATTVTFGLTLTVILGAPFALLFLVTGFGDAILFILIRSFLAIVQQTSHRGLLQGVGSSEHELPSDCLRTAMFGY